MSNSIKYLTGALLTFFLFVAGSCFSANTPSDTTQSHNTVRHVPRERMPSFKGGDKELVKFIVSHLKYPLAAKTANIQGKVIVKFVIRENGKADCFSISKNVDPLLDAEALRVVSSMPKWKPGKKDGKPVPVWFNLPVNFVLN